MSYLHEYEEIKLRPNNFVHRVVYSLAVAIAMLSCCKKIRALYNVQSQDRRKQKNDAKAKP